MDLSPDKVVRADDERGVAPKERKHGISDVNPHADLPVGDAGTIINTAHTGFRGGSNDWGEQIFLPQSLATMFLRVVQNKVWSSWRRTLLSTDDQVSNIDDFGEFISIVNKSQAGKPGNKNGILISIPYFVNRPDGKWGAQLYITEVDQDLYFRKKDNNVWGPWKRVLTDVGVAVESNKKVLNLVPTDTAHFTFNTASRLARFIGYRQGKGDYIGYVEVDCKVKIATGDFGGEVILKTPAGWRLAETIQACGDLFQTGSGGHFWRLWSENDNLGDQSLLRTWNNNSDIPRGVDLRLMYNFPCVLMENQNIPSGPLPAVE
jgi:hypothetical protein